MEMLRVAHYLNQFFGGIGGEEKAEAGPMVHQGAVGPGRAI
ncbi:MAG: glycine/sarcosine/betaine reductase selenoprotein B family protein, partial [Thermodesulfobacteriota bacterium]